MSEKGSDDSVYDGDESESRTQLDAALTNLQRSFSRVSRDAAIQAKAHPEEALAYISGEVSFRLSLRVSPEKESIYVDNDGNTELFLEGKLRTDIRTIAKDVDTEGNNTD